MRIQPQLFPYRSYTHAPKPTPTPSPQNDAPHAIPAISSISFGSQANALKWLNSKVLLDKLPEYIKTLNPKELKDFMDHMGLLMPKLSSDHVSPEAIANAFGDKLQEPERIAFQKRLEDSIKPGSTAARWVDSDRQPKPLEGWVALARKNNDFPLYCLLAWWMHDSAQTLTAEERAKVPSNKAIQQVLKDNFKITYSLGTIKYAWEVLGLLMLLYQNVETERSATKTMKAQSFDNLMPLYQQVQDYLRQKRPGTIITKAEIGGHLGLDSKNSTNARKITFCWRALQQGGYITFVQSGPSSGWRLLKPIPSSNGTPAPAISIRDPQEALTAYLNTLAPGQSLPKILKPAELTELNSKTGAFFTFPRARESYQRFTQGDSPALLNPGAVAHSGYVLLNRPDGTRQPGELSQAEILKMYGFKDLAAARREKLPNALERTAVRLAYFIELTLQGRYWPNPNKRQQDYCLPTVNNGKFKIPAIKELAHIIQSRGLDIISVLQNWKKEQVIEYLGIGRNGGYEFTGKRPKV